MEVKKGMRVVGKLDGIKATITNIEGDRATILDDGDLIPWFIHRKAVATFFREIKEEQ